ncbi:hypothetical protein ACJMK2_022881 [Sinanodonta woodiana]|uniref:KAT8 regulatory NSL complex subunit 2 n=1 Tax=Sinanodonta woodiana TaxID=1069815 RepID=A0ABD3TKD0_SINWO
MSRGGSKSQLRKMRQPVEGLFCSYTHRTCMQNRLEGYEFCLKHILEDKNAPFKQCSYTSSKNGKRCTTAAPKSDKKDGYCIEHSKKALLLRQRASRKRRPRETAESLLEELDQYSEMRQLQEGIPTNLLSERLLATPGGEPTNHKRLKPRNDNPASKALEYATSSDSDEETLLVDQAWRGDGDSDAESIDSEQEDPLKHAGVYTAEEVALIMRDKLIRLQSLYIDQFKRLQHVLREKRRKYLKTYKQEMETLGGIGSYKKDHEQRETYCKLEAMRRYHKRYGKEALLHRQSKQRRIAASEGSNYRPTPYSKCIYTEDKARCCARAVPLSKYCKDHILYDPQQVLFRSCSFGAGACRRPVASFEGTAVCPLHVLPSDREPRVPVKKVTETQVDVLEDPSDRSVAGKESGQNGDAAEDYKRQKSIKGQLLLQHLQGHGPDLSRSPGLSTNQTTAMASHTTNQTTAMASQTINQTTAMASHTTNQTATTRKSVQLDMGLANQIKLNASNRQKSMLTGSGPFQHQQGMSTTGTGPHQGMSKASTGQHQQGISIIKIDQQGTSTATTGQHQQGMNTAATDQHQPGISTTSTDQNQLGMSTAGTDQQDTSTASTDQHEMSTASTDHGMSTASTDQHQQGMSTASTGQHGMSTASTDQHQQGMSTASTGQRGMSTASTDQHQQDMSTASTDQQQQGMSTARTDQQQQGMSSARTDQQQQGMSTARTDQQQQGMSTARTDQQGMSNASTDQHQ